VCLLAGLRAKYARFEATKPYTLHLQDFIPNSIIIQRNLRSEESVRSVCTPKLFRIFARRVFRFGGPQALRSFHKLRVNSQYGSYCRADKWNVSEDTYGCSFGVFRWSFFLLQSVSSDPSWLHVLTYPVSRMNIQECEDRFAHEAVDKTADKVEVPFLFLIRSVHSAQIDADPRRCSQNMFEASRSNRSSRGFIPSVNQEAMLRRFS
jgi:hypothetical protein